MRDFIFVLMILLMVLGFGIAIKSDACGAEPNRSYITNTHRQVIGDVYNPGHGKPAQIRDKHRRVIGHIEGNGTITDKNRRPVGNVKGLGNGR
jgi:hypothetical protein